MERQLISSGAAFEERVGYSRAVRIGDRVWVSGTAPIMPGDADPPATPLRAGEGLPRRSSSVRSTRRASSLDDVVRTRIYVTDAAFIDDVGPRARRGVRAGAAGDDRHRHAAARSALARGDRGGSGDTALVKQIFPPSITGKGSTGTSAEHASVLDHKFGQGDPYTLGVEEEYMLLDPETWDLVQHIDSVLAAVEERRARGPPARGADAVGARGDDARLPDRGRRDALARRSCAAMSPTSRATEGCRFGSAGTHPFSLFERQRITARDRYRNLVDQLQYIARRELIFGMHMHVAVDDPEKAIQVMNGLLVYLPQMLALSASSPFWRGEPTGLSSSRQMVFAAFPRSGPPPRFRDYADYAEVVGQLERTGCIADYTHIWWDIRPHPRLGTIEMRVCDAVTRLEDVVAITAFFQALVKLHCELYEAGREIPTWHRLLTTENKWLAARYGLEAPIMDLATGRRNRVPGRAARSAGRCATSSRTRGSSARSASSKGSARSSRAATAPTVSCACGTRTATSSRSCGRSRWRPRPRSSAKHPAAPP